MKYLEWLNVLIGKHGVEGVFDLTGFLNVWNIASKTAYQDSLSLYSGTDPLLTSHWLDFNSKPVMKLQLMLENNRNKDHCAFNGLLVSFL